MATSLRTNVVVVTRVHCIWTFYLAFSCYCNAIVLFKNICLKIESFIWDWTSLKTHRTSLLSLLLAHCRLNILSHTVYWKSPISILGMSGYEIYIFLKKKWLNYLQTVETLIRFCILRCLIWVCTVCQLPFRLQWVVTKFPTFAYFFKNIYPYFSPIFSGEGSFWTALSGGTILSFLNLFLSLAFHCLLLLWLAKCQIVSVLKLEQVHITTMYMMMS